MKELSRRILNGNDKSESEAKAELATSVIQPLLERFMLYLYLYVQQQVTQTRKKQKQNFNRQKLSN